MASCRHPCWGHLKHFGPGMFITGEGRGAMTPKRKIYHVRYSVRSEQIKAGGFGFVLGDGVNDWLRSSHPGRFPASRERQVQDWGKGISDISESVTVC